MMVLLLWLTLSLPVVYSYQQQLKKEATQKAASNSQSSDDNNNPLSNTNEEKSESGGNTLSEYLHDAPLIEQHFTTLTTYYKCHSSSAYVAFHPAPLSPPPDLA